VTGGSPFSVKLVRHECATVTSGWGGKIVTEEVCGANRIVRVLKTGAGARACCGHSGEEATIDAGGVLASDGVAVLQALNAVAGELTETHPEGIKNARALSCAIGGEEHGELTTTPLNVRVCIFWGTRTLDSSAAFERKLPPWTQTVEGSCNQWWPSALDTEILCATLGMSIDLRRSQQASERWEDCTALDGGHSLDAQSSSRAVFASAPSLGSDPVNKWSGNK
jgi:hypothetical protein